MSQLITKPHGEYVVKKSAITWLLLVFLTLPHMDPEYLGQIPMWENMLDWLRLASFVVVVFWILIIKKKTTVIVILIGVWEIFLFATTVIHHGDVYRSATSAFSVISIALLYDAADSEGDTFLSSQLFCFELVTYINMYTVFAFPEGMYSLPPEYHTKNWFLGYYNMFTRFFVPALMFAWLYKMRTGRSWRTYLLTAAITVTVIKVWSGSEIALLCAMFVVYIFLKNATRIFNYYNYWILHIVFFVGVFVFRLQDLLQWFIRDILGKWSSLMGRMDYWDKTYELFLKYPLFGHGIQNSLTVRRVELNSIAGAHAHNLVFELLYEGGIIGIVLWCTVVIVAGKRLYQFRQTPESKIIATAFLGWCIATLVEPYMTSFLMGMFVIAYRSNKSEVAFKRLSPYEGQGGIHMRRVRSRQSGEKI